MSWWIFVVIAIVVVAALAGLVARKRRRNNKRVIAQLKKHRAIPAIANAAYDMSEHTSVVGHRLDPQRPVFAHPTYSTAADEEAVYQDGDAPLYAVPLEGSGTAHVVKAVPSDGTGSSMSYTHFNPCFAVPPTGPPSGPTLPYDTLAKDMACASAAPHDAEQSQQQQLGYDTVEKPQSLQSNTAGVFTKPYDTDTVVSPAASVIELYSIPSEDGTTVVYAEPEQLFSVADSGKCMEVTSDDATA